MKQERKPGIQIFMVAMAMLWLTACATGRNLANRECPAVEGSAGTTPAAKVKILVLVDNSQPLQFLYQTRGREITHVLISKLGGILPIVIDSSLYSTAQSADTTRFQKAIGEFDRRPALAAALIDSTRRAAPLFELVPPAPERYSDYLRSGKPDFDVLKKDGWKYALVITDKFTGMATSDFGSVATYIHAQYTVYDVTREEKLNSGEVRRVSTTIHDYDSAIGERKIFLTEYPQVAAYAGNDIIGLMNRNDVFYAIGCDQGLGGKVHPMSKIFADNVKRFDYSFELPSGWKEQKYVSKDHKSDGKYRIDFGPKADWQTVGDAFTVDLLVEAFGNNVKTLREYQNIFLARLAAAGYPADTVKPFNGLKLDPSWEVFSLMRPDRIGREVVAMRKVGDVVFIHDFVFIRDYGANFAKYKADIEYLVNKGRYVVDGRS